MSNIKTLEVPLIDGWGEKNVKQFSPSDLVNLYIDKNNSGEFALLSTPGLGGKISFGTRGGVRQMHTSELVTNMHLVVNDIIWQCDTSLNPIFGKKINTFTGYVSIESSVNQTMFCDGEHGYIFDKVTNVYNQITSINTPPKPGTISVLGARFLVNELESDRLHISDIKDGMLWSGNIITLGESSYPEKIVSHGTIRGRLFIFGTRCTEVWYPVGTYPYFARDNNLLLEYGCASAGSVAIGEDMLVWLGIDKQGVTSVMVTNGGMPERISTSEIESEFQKYDISDAQAFIYKNAGTIFYQINFTKSNKSFLRNFTTGTWSRLGNLENRHLGSCHAFFQAKHYIGDYKSPCIYHISNDYAVDYNEAIKRKFVTRAIYIAEKFIVHRVRVYMQQGTGIEGPNTLNNGYNADIDPKLFLKVSEDNGIRFSSALEADIGKIGKSITVCDFFRLGYFEYGSIVLDFEHYSHTPCNIFKILIEYSTI